MRGEMVGRLKILAILATLVVVGVVWAGGAKWSNRDFSASLSVVTTGDTAQAIKVHTFTARDSFLYIDTINDTPITWVSPLQVRRIVPVVDTTLTYSCSLRTGAGATGFTYVMPEFEVLDTLTKHITDSINAVAGMSDTLLAQDSSTYVKVISKFAMDNLPSDARWDLTLGDSLTQGDSTFTTIEMVCDSMPTYINANSVLAAVLTAANSGDTVYSITSDDPGLAFTIVIGDTAQDTSLTQANVASYSGTTDTIWIDKFVERNHSFNSLVCQFIIEPSYITTQGIGGADSGYLWLYSAWENNWGLLAVDTQASLPCTLYYSKPAGAGTDTLFKEDMILVYRIADSASDTTATVPYNISSYYMLKDK